MRPHAELAREALHLYFDLDLAGRIARLRGYVQTKREQRATEKGRRATN